MRRAQPVPHSTTRPRAPRRQPPPKPAAIQPRVYAAGFIGAGIIAAMFYGCARTGSGPDAATANIPDALVKAPAKPAPDTDKPSPAPTRLDSAAADLETLFKTLGSAASAEAAPDDPHRLIPTAPRTVPSSATAQGPKPETIVPTPANPAPPAPISIEQQRSDAARRLAEIMRPDGVGLREPVRAALPLLAIELIDPAAARSALADIEQSLTANERRQVQAIRDLLHRANQTATAAQDAEGTVPDLEISPQPHDGLALGTVALCSRVESFGRFAPLPTDRFIAGRATPVIIYSEVENFAQSGASDSGHTGAWSMELSQEVRLILDSDGSIPWSLPEGRVRDSSRSRRRDYFLAQRIDLPANLSVGKYTLKVIVRDRGGGGGHPESVAEAEANIPIQIVAVSTAVKPPSVPIAAGPLTPSNDAKLPMFGPTSRILE